MRYCKHCKKPLEHGGWGKSEYCNASCKQASYRARIKAEAEKPDTFGSDAPIDDRTPTEKAIETKRNEQRWKVCSQCREQFPVDGTQKARRYCSDACKQSAYRSRQEWRKIWSGKKDVQAPTEKITVIDNVSKIVTEAWSDAIED
jgi:hypothetical protein